MDTRLKRSQAHLLECSSKVRLTIQKSRIDGKGVFAKESIKKRSKIGEVQGELTSLSVGRALAKRKRRIMIVELGNGKALDARKGGILKFINHSCCPNTFMRIINCHVEIYALREINKSEELTCDYGNTHHNGKLRCKCGDKKCRRFL